MLVLVCVCDLSTPQSLYELLPSYPRYGVARCHHRCRCHQGAQKKIKSSKLTTKFAFSADVAAAGDGPTFLIPAASSSPGSAAPVAAALPALPQQHAAEEPSALELRNSYASRARGRRVAEPHPTASHRAYPPNLSSPSGTSLPPFAGCGGREPENDRTNSSPDVTGCFLAGMTTW